MRCEACIGNTLFFIRVRGVPASITTIHVGPSSLFKVRPRGLGDSPGQERLPASPGHPSIPGPPGGPAGGAQPEVQRADAGAAGAGRNDDATGDGAAGNGELRKQRTTRKTSCR